MTYVIYTLFQLQNFFVFFSTQNWPFSYLHVWYTCRTQFWLHYWSQFS